MVICPHCQEELLDPTQPCPACGHELPTGNPRETNVLGPLTPRPMRRQQVWQSAEISETLVISAFIDEQPVPIHLSEEGPVVLGREKTSDGPDVDLMPFNAHEKGVSHLHAEIALTDGLVEIRDLGSTNGTYLNGQKLQAEQWRILRNLDEVYLGRLRMVIRFEDAPVES